MKILCCFILFLCSFFFSIVEGIVPIAVDASGHEWMDEAIRQEYVYYNSQGITLENLEYTWRACKTGPYRNLLKRFQVIDSKVYGPEGIIKNLLIEMTKHYRVPNVDFIYSYSDDIKEDFIRTYFSKNNAPILVSAKNKNSYQVICFIDHFHDICASDGGHGHWHKFIREINANQDKWPWEKKKAKLFWRGSASDDSYTISNWWTFPRGRLVALSRYYPEKLDSAFTYLYLMPPNDVELFKKNIGLSSNVSIEDHLPYKYQIALDGVTTSYPGVQWRLLSGCLTFMQESNNVMWFFPALRSEEHYIPVRHDLSNLLEKIEWAQTHDFEAQQIVLRAKQFALTHVMPEHVLLYCYKSLCKYASLQRFTPRKTIHN